jgi:iron complex transport system substrate-binding protein
MTQPTRLTALLLAVGLALAGCGDDDEASTGSGGSDDAGSDAASTDAEAAEFPVTLETDGGTIEIAEQPDRIVSLSATATEMLFAIDAGDQVVAADDQSNYPDDAPTTDLSGLEPNVEAIAGYEPDLVVTSGDPGDVVAGLDTLGIPTLVHPAAVTLDDTYEQITSLGTATGHADDAAELVAQMEDDIAALVEQVPDRVQALTYYHELDSTLYTVTSETFIGELYALAGLENVADPADDGSAGGYPQLSPEFLVQADPDIIFLADTKCCGQDATTVAARPGWADLTAVTEGNVVELDDDIASRWGPRVVDLLETIVQASEGSPEPVER